MNNIDQPQHTKAEEQAYNQAHNTPPEPQHGREPELLAEYLSKYLDHEHENGEGYTSCFLDTYPDGTVTIDVTCLGIALKQALEAYESTENVVIQIIKKKER